MTAASEDQTPAPQLLQVIDPAEILARNDFAPAVQASSSAYRKIYRSEGPPVAEIHLSTTAYLVMPETKLATRLPDTVLDDVLGQQRQQTQENTGAADQAPTRA